MIAKFFTLVALVIVGGALIVAAFGTLGIFAAIPVGGALIYFALVGRHPGARAPTPHPESSEPSGNRSRALAIPKAADPLPPISDARFGPGSGKATHPL